MSMNAHERRDAGLSATMVIDKCKRSVILKQEHDYVERPSEMFPRTRGSMFHFLFEYYSEGLEPFIQEERFTRSIEVDGQEVTLTGKPDLIILDRNLIVDAKSVGDVYSEYKSISKGIAVKSHVEQVNIYRWLVGGGLNMKRNEVMNVFIDKGEIQYFDMNAEKKVEVEIWPLEKTEAFIRTSLSPLVQYQLTGELPPILTNLWGQRAGICNYCPVIDHCTKRAK